MRIAVGIHHLWPRGGQEGHCLRMAEALIARGHDVTIFSRSEAGDLRIPVVTMSDQRRRPNHVQAAQFATEFRERTSTGFDRKVAFQLVPGVDVLFIGEDLRNSRDAGFLKRLTPRFRTLCALEEGIFGTGSSTRIVGYSATQMSGFADRYPDSRRRIAVLPPTLQRHAYRPEMRASAARIETRRSLGIADGEKAWLWIGLQPEIKGLDRVVEALATQKDATLLIGGLESGHRKAHAIRRQISKLGVSDRVRFLGYVTSERIPSVLAAADVLAHPARREASGATILEALVNGVPVVTTDVCGFAAHVEKSGAGVVLPSPFDQQAFADALCRVCGKDAQSFSRRGIAYGASPYLYSGIDVACDLIESDEWPADVGL